MAVQQDSSGFRIFGNGDLGRVHVLAHRMLDQDKPIAGHTILGAWLEGRRGEGSDWVHVQWHMMVFELAVGAWKSAHARCLRHVIPAARGDGAATDAPSALWRLELAAPEPVSLPWQEVRASALRRLHTPKSAFVTLHDLLALAGAGDVPSLEEWRGRLRPRTQASRTLELFAQGLSCFARDEHSDAARALALALPSLPAIGGSRAQNELFHEIYRIAARRSTANDSSHEAPLASRASGFR